MTKHALKILLCLHPNVFKVCLTIFQRYEWKGKSKASFSLAVLIFFFNVANQEKKRWFNYFRKKSSIADVRMGSKYDWHHLKAFPSLSLIPS